MIPKQTFDTDNSGNLSAGDTIALVTEDYFNFPYVDEITYQQLTNDDLNKLKTTGLI